MATSAVKKKIIAMTANTSTITVEIIVSRRDGQVTLAVSDANLLEEGERICGFRSHMPLCLQDPLAGSPG